MTNLYHIEIYYTLRFYFPYLSLLAQPVYITVYCTSVYEHHYKIVYIKIAIFLLFQTIERSIVFKTMDRQCQSFSRIFSSATGLDKSFIFIRNTALSINENSEIFNKFLKFPKNSKYSRFQRFSTNFKNFSFHQIS